MISRNIAFDSVKRLTYVKSVQLFWLQTIHLRDDMNQAMSLEVGCLNSLVPP